MEEVLSATWQRLLQTTNEQAISQGDYAADLGLFFGIQFVLLVSVPGVIMFWRLILGWKDGFMTMFKAPQGRMGLSKRSPASALRFILFEQTSYGYYMDVTQAVFSAISCIMFIAVAYSSYDPTSVQDIEFFFTCYFIADYFLRLYIAQDSLSFFFSGVSMLDFVTVVPAVVTWLLSGLTQFESNVQIIVQYIRVMRVFRIFRVIRVIRVISVNQSYAFQRQVGVLIMTVLSLVFAAAGLFQIFESSPGKEYPFHKAVYYAAITVIGRPGVPFTAAVTAVFLTVLGMSAATIIPTFVAELIRLWYDNTALDKYKPNPENPHVIVCGDTNASRLRVLVTQYFHPSRDPNTIAPIVILAEAKPEGALRALLEQYKHSGMVQYIRGSGRRTADLRRAGAGSAAACVVLNYRADREAGTADTEVLSTIMAVKNVKPDIRVLAQLHRPRKRHQLKLVPGWSDGDKAIASHALGMTLVGVGTALPGFPTLVTHLLRRGTVRDEHVATWKQVMKDAWRTFLYGEAAKPVDFRDTDEAGRVKSRTPLDEYASSIEQQIYEVWVTSGLAGRTFGAAARLAYLRYGVTLLGATVPVNEDLQGVMNGLPRTYRLALFPSSVMLSQGMKLYVISNSPEPLEKMHVETGGKVRNMLERALIDDVQWIPKMDLPDMPKLPSSLAKLGAKGLAGQDETAANAADAPVAAENVETAGQVQGAHIPLPSLNIFSTKYAHNDRASQDLATAWCWKEHDLDGSNTNAFLSLLHINVGASPAATASSSSPAATDASGHRSNLCEGCGKPSAKCLDSRLLSGTGIMCLDSAKGLSAYEGESMPAAVAVGTPGATLPKTPLKQVTGAQFDPFAGQGGEEDATDTPTPVSAGTPNAGTGLTDVALQRQPSAGGLSGLAVDDPMRLALGTIVGKDGRRPSLGDDGFGGIDDTDDISGLKGNLPTQAPVSTMKSAGSAQAAAAAATQANTNALAVRLALPMAAQASEDLTLVLPTATTGGGLSADLLSAGAAGGAAAQSKYRGHVLVCGVSDSIGLLLRAVASLITKGKRKGSKVSGAATPTAVPADFLEGDQYDLEPSDVVILAASKPAEAAMNAQYAGSARLLAKVTFVTGNPSDTTELLKAGVLTARCAVVLTMSKASVSADGSDNLSDDTEAIMCTSVLHKLNPRLHIITELLHGGHAPFILPVGANLNDAQRAAFAYILEEREAVRLRQQLDDAVRHLQVDKGVALAASGSGAKGVGSAASSRLLAKLLRQQARLRALHSRVGVPRGLSRAGGGGQSAHNVIDSSAADAMGGAGGKMHLEVELEGAFSNLNSSAIVDVLVGVREDFGSASAAANDGASFNSGSSGPSGGSSKGSGATSDLFSSPAFASGRVFSFATLDSVITEAHFSPYIVGVVKQLVRAARRSRLFMLPVAEAVIMARIAATINVHAGQQGTPAPTITAEAVERVREAYLKEVAYKASGKEGGRDGGAGAPVALPEGMKFERYGQLMEALLRCWKLLPMGLYRRVHPATGLKTNGNTSASVAAAAGLPTLGSGFLNNRALVSFVYTNPEADTLLSPHDYLYVLSSDDEEGSDANIIGLNLDADE